MEGVQFIVNNKGQRTGVLIDLKKHRDLWEDLYDGLVARQRKDEPRESLKTVRQRLRRQGKLATDE
jgi:hypothetical protein